MSGEHATLYSRNSRRCVSVQAPTAHNVLHSLHCSNFSFFINSNWMSDFLSTHKFPLVLSATLCLSYLLFLFWNEVFVTLTLVPTEVLVTNNRVWTFITSPFIEGNACRLVVNICLIFVVTSPAEVKCDVFDHQFSLYMSSNLLASTVGSFMWLLIRFFGSDHQSFMLESCYGSGGVVMLLTMYTRRHVGGRAVLPQLPAVTFHYLPTVILSAVTLLRLLRFRTMTTDILFVYFTFFSSWAYLHFYHKVEGPDDHANSFTFVGMFPEALHPVVQPLSIATYNFFSLIGLCPKLELDRRGLQHHLRYHDTKKHAAGAGPGVGGGGDAVGSSSSGSSSEDLIAERRRAKALKLLDAKMAELSKEPEGWEDLKEEEGANKDKV